MTLSTTNKNHTSLKRLSVQISLTGLSFFILDQATGQAKYEHVQFSNEHQPDAILMQIKNTLRTFNETSFSQITLIYTSALYTLVPSSLFDENRASEYLKFNAKILANDYIANDHIDAQQLEVVYIPLVNINNYFFETYGSFKYFHSSSLLIKKLTEKEQNQSGQRVYAHVLENTFTLLIFKDGALKLCNTYNYQSPEDFIYYILFAFEQIKLNPDTVPVSLFGNISEENDLFAICYQYIRNLSIIDPDNWIDATIKINGLENRTTLHPPILHTILQ